MEGLKRLALALVIIGAVNWGLIGFFQFDLVAAIFGGQEAALSRVVYALVGLSGLYCLTLLFDPMEEKNTERENSAQTGRLNYGTEFGEESDLSNLENHDQDTFNKND
ncbi:DUF378 domain-containing protein [Tenuibacillus multivorans]|uniref:DUF378 domain-containing protein n=1 Tax=Tenuibacillus multivorans TaxID=237069 RepID=A0A1G9ZXJ9_9BACI|nr:DUF378 domain-containing protein [Tenuibacillus multivorans]GEL76884.1 hypothetical protein TMU01_11190 [Tenuibacillus multivorans]SDN25814.1 hypothetical protein SAMN05216498_1876 [Tenuibacillus multivorans]